MEARMKFDPRKYMEMAIATMKESINEFRGDGKASPLVGAVLWKPDGSVETAHRGELRDGDHAEFTLLERKNRANKLDGCILFATLEPCAPGARKHPKLCCAERIVNARIRQVWVGIEDPDPLVDRKGIKFLQDHNVTRIGLVNGRQLVDLLVEHWVHMPDDFKNKLGLKPGLVRG
jgi:ATP-dependent DNA helicase RecG